MQEGIIDHAVFTTRQTFFSEYMAGLDPQIALFINSGGLQVHWLRLVFEVLLSGVAFSHIERKEKGLSFISSTQLLAKFTQHKKTVSAPKSSTQELQNVLNVVIPSILMSLTINFDLIHECLI